MTYSSNVRKKYCICYQRNWSLRSSRNSLCEILLNSAPFRSFQMSVRQWLTRFSFSRKKKRVLYLTRHYWLMTRSRGCSVAYSKRTYSPMFEMVKKKLGLTLSWPERPEGSNLNLVSSVPSSLISYARFTPSSIGFTLWSEPL